MSPRADDRRTPCRPCAAAPPSHRALSCAQTLASLILAVSFSVSFPFTAGGQAARARPAASQDAWSPFVDEAAERFAIPAAWIRAVMRVESRGDVKAVSPKGAIGLMQVMPATYNELRIRYALGADPYDPHDNIMAGAAYLREMHDRFGAAGFLAAYNAGPARYDDHLATGRPLPGETRNYVATLTPMLSGTLSADSASRAGEPGTWRKASLFVPRSPRTSPGTLQALIPQPSRIKADRTIADLSALAPFSAGLFVRKTDVPGAR